MPVKFDFISPGVLLREIDQSVLPPTVDEEGPVIIGRTVKGPAMKPVKIRSLDDFLTIFGKPVPGGISIGGDVWRDGHPTGPTYASYAAQAWLASNNSPITMVRLLGDNQPGATSGLAGWKTEDSTPHTGHADNGGAYGLWIFNSASSGDTQGGLGAIFYVDSGALALSGTAVLDSLEKDTQAPSCGRFFKSVGTNSEFKMSVINDSGNETEILNFNFKRNDQNYIRSVFNTNPQLTNSSIHNGTVKTYWLGESFVNEVEEYATSGSQYGIMLALNTGSVNWADNNSVMKEAKSGWVFSQDVAGAADTYEPANQQKLFKFIAIQDGEDTQQNIVIAIKNLKLPSNPLVDNWSSFSVAVLDFQTGETLESYDLLNLNPSSPNYIANRIGNMYQTWSETDRRYKVYGDYPVQSDYIRMEMDEDIDQANIADTTYLPFGFYGPVVPKGFSAVSGTTTAIAYGDAAKTAFAGAFAEAKAEAYGCTGADFVDNFVAMPFADYTASFNWPKINLRASGSDGYAPNNFKSYFGIRPTISTTSTTKDPDYVDYVRRNLGCETNYQETPAADYEYSFLFSLDDIVITGSNSTEVYYQSGSRVSEESFTALSGASGLISQNVKQFVIPLFGGFNGLNIKEAEPFRNSGIGTSEATNYQLYTLNKAIDTVADPEIVQANIMIAPGITKSGVTNKLMNTCEARKDALAIIDLTGDYVPNTENTSDASERRGLVSTAVSDLKSRNLNNSYACAFYPWVQITDNINNGEKVWIPSSIAGLGAMAQSEAKSELWFAPAGFNRGGLGNLGGAQGPRVVQARQRLDSSDRDDLYEVNINPIATFPNEGVVIFGQKTLQVTPSALDRINVRRLLIYLKSKVGNISRNLLFDQNIASTWARFKSQVNPLLADVQARFGITEYKLILDETTTTPDLIDRNIMYAKIFLKPARAIEFIVVDFVITKSGAEFV